MAEPTREYEGNMVKYTEDIDPETGKQLTDRQKKHAFRRSQAAKKEVGAGSGTGSYFGKTSKQGRKYLKRLEEAGKI